MMTEPASGGARIAAGVCKEAYARTQATPIGWSYFRQCIAGLHEYVHHTLMCPVFDAKIPSRVFFRDYFRQQKNMLLLEGEAAGLTDGIHGFTCMRRVVIENQKRRIFLVLISDIENEFEWNFTVAHEVGHVLLHGRILNPLMMIPRHWNAWYHESYDHRRRMLEAECNAYALFSLVPTELIRMVSDITGRPSNVDDLRHAISFLFREHINESFVRERLNLDTLLHGYNEPAREIEARCWFVRSQEMDHSWLWHGSDGCPPAEKPSTSLSDTALGLILKGAKQKGILSREHHSKIYYDWYQELMEES